MLPLNLPPGRETNLLNEFAAENFNYAYRNLCHSHGKIKSSGQKVNKAAAPLSHGLTPAHFRTLKRWCSETSESSIIYKIQVGSFQLANFVLD